MEKETLRYRKLSMFQLILLFFITYFCTIFIFSLLNEFINLGFGILLQQVIYLFVFLLFILRTQLHYFILELSKTHFTVREYIGKKEKYVMIIPKKHIVSVTDFQKNKDRYYNKRKKIVKAFLKNQNTCYIEYDDFEDISLFKIRCSKKFLTNLSNCM